MAIDKEGTPVVQHDVTCIGLYEDARGPHFFSEFLML
jgi:hypothetical protein